MAALEVRLEIWQGRIDLHAYLPAIGEDYYDSLSSLCFKLSFLMHVIKSKHILPGLMSSRFIVQDCIDAIAGYVVNEIPSGVRRY